MKVRPISVGPAVYRLWPAVRARHVGAMLAPRFRPHQAATAGSIGPHGLLLDMEVQQAMGCGDTGVSLDFEKAFDRSSWAIALWVLERWGCPSFIVNTLQFQWENQTRWLTLDGAVHPEPTTGHTGFPQGDPFSPLGLACFLAPVFEKLWVTVPGCHYLYADDRTSLVASQHVERVLQVWNELEEVTRMKGNAGKMQVWSLNDDSQAGFVLGVVKSSGQDTHRKEQERLKQVEATAERIGTLPVAISTRSAVANCMLAPKAVWDQFITGRKGPGHGSWKQIYRKAAMGCFHPGGRASRDLELVSRWGHVADLGFLACQRYLVSLQKWWWVFGRHVRGPLPRLPSMQLVSSELGRLGWHAVNWGQWSWQGIELDCRQRIGELLASFHSLRESWRASTFLRWVSSRTRRDSEIARGMHLQYSEGLGKILRGLNKELGGDSCAVMVGGMSTPATCAEQNRPLTCPYCRIDVVPCLDHVLWHCRAFADDRGIARPQCELAARLGWAPDMTKEACRALLVQMGVIRGKEAALRRRLRAGGALHL